MNDRTANAIVIGLGALAIVGAALALYGCGGAAFEPIGKTAIVDSVDAEATDDAPSAATPEILALPEVDAAIPDVVNTPDAAPVQAATTPDAAPDAAPDAGPTCDLVACPRCPYEAQGSTPCCAATACGCTNFGPTCLPN